MISNVFIISLIAFFNSEAKISWGFYAHKEINRIAIFTLPPEMLKFYKHNLGDIVEGSVKPDMRRYSNPMEQYRHYIDLDVYLDSLQMNIPAYKKDLQDTLGIEFVQQQGIVPWHIQVMRRLLTQSFIDKDYAKIVKYSSEIGHYIADAHVPLHTTSNYNGQFTNQKGIHGLWESRLPELFLEEYDLFTGRAQYIEQFANYFWNNIIIAHQAVDSVLWFEKELSENEYLADKYVVEGRNGSSVTTYNDEFCRDYHSRLNGMVERQMRSAIKAIGDTWYTCWIDAGQPKLSTD